MGWPQTAGALSPTCLVLAVPFTPHLNHHPGQLLSAPDKVWADVSRSASARFMEERYQ